MCRSGEGDDLIREVLICADFDLICIEEVGAVNRVAELNSGLDIGGHIVLS